MSRKFSQSIRGTHQTAFPVFVWTQITEAGAYVEWRTGDLYRIPKEALRAGASPIITKESREGLRMVKISKDPFVPTVQARLRCARYSLSPNF